ncbi:MAG: phosphate ABC transporter substrate-binding protein PstS [Propionibacteriaceae bacterium]|nr:phosphate ABC transporter substrate-binding protein PstS [Propionibacteriaceae bacterium]
MNKRLVQATAIASAAVLGVTACGGGVVVTPTGGTGRAAQSSYSCPEGQLVGGGATSQKLAIDTLISDYARECGGKATIEYSGTGSGAGIKDFYNAQIDWAGSDSALRTTPNSDQIVEAGKAAERCGGPAWNLPLVIGPVAFAYNLDEVNKLTLTPAVIGDIAFGRITRWDDPAIASLNPGVALPDLAISVFFRSDESGTTENMTEFLKAAAPGNFTAETSKKWPGTVGEGKKGTQGVAEGVAATRGGFGYMEWKFATDNRLGVAAIDNGAGPVALTPETVAKGVEGARVSGEGHDLSLDLAYSGTAAGAYPAIMVSYEVVCSTGLDAAKTALMKDFLSFMASADEQEALVDKGYGPLPEALRTKVTQAIEAIR